MSDGLFEEAGDMGIVQFVDLLAALFLGPDETEVSKHSKVLRHRWLLHIGFGGELLDRARPLGQAAEELDPAPGGEAVHRVGYEVRRSRIDGRQIDVVPLADLAIIPEMHARRRMHCGIVTGQAKCAQGARMGEQSSEIWKTNPEVGASPRSLA